MANALEGQTCRAYVSPLDVRVPRADEDDADIDTLVQPDVLVICDREKTDRRGVRGGPDVVGAGVAKPFQQMTHIAPGAV